MKGYVSGDPNSNRGCLAEFHLYDDFFLGQHERTGWKAYASAVQTYPGDVNHHEDFAYNLVDGNPESYYSSPFTFDPIPDVAQSSNTTYIYLNLQTQRQIGSFSIIPRKNQGDKNFLNEFSNYFICTGETYQELESNCKAHNMEESGTLLFTDTSEQIKYLEKEYNTQFFGFGVYGKDVGFRFRVVSAAELKLHRRYLGFLNRNTWTFDSELTNSEYPGTGNEGPGELSLDGYYSTHYHSNYDQRVEMPYRVTFDLGQVQTFNGIVIFPRFDNSDGCRILNYRIYSANTLMT